MVLKFPKKKFFSTRWIVPTLSADTSTTYVPTLNIVPQYYYSTAFWTKALLHGNLGIYARFCSMCGGNPRPSEGPGTQTGFAGAVDTPGVRTRDAMIKTTTLTSRPRPPRDMSPEGPDDLQRTFPCI